jgi:hypothetical protein
MTSSDRVELREVLLQPGLERFEGGRHIVQWGGLVHAFLRVMGLSNHIVPGCAEPVNRVLRHQNAKPKAPL